MARLVRRLSDEFIGFHFRLLLVRLVMNLLPPHVGSQLRVYLLRLVGFRIGRGTMMWGTPTLIGNSELYHNLVIGEECWINIDCLLELGAPIIMGNHVALGQQVMIITTTHDIGATERRAGSLQTKAVTIGDGAWIGTRATILPGVTIGSGAVVAAGAMVNKSIEANLLVGGVPARILRELPTDGQERQTVLSEVAALVHGSQEVYHERV